jgi:hypothetical protein
MKISTILDHTDSGHMALPEFQRGYVWNRDQVRGLFDSLYRRHPVGGLLVWATESKTATHRGDGLLAERSLERKREYSDWSERVAAGCRGSNAALERLYDETVAEGRRILASV